MKFSISSGGVSNDFIASFVAIAAVVSCIFLADQLGDVRPVAPKNAPYIVIVSDNGIAEEKCVSAGFFLPTAYNANRRATIPGLTCEVNAMDIGSIAIFGAGEKSRITSAMNPNQNVMDNNILGSVVLYEVHDFSATGISISDGVTFFEDIETGICYGCDSSLDDYSGRSILCLADRDMAFASPSEFTESLGRIAANAENSWGCVKFLKMKNLKIEFPTEGKMQ
ncbi:MAG: hypothetical protein LBR91_00830 [Puniceicoccales bacterium]|jgi:hypothetical protein|nr:hypothetical protein [Puniceicoccales bacterium]